jgi:hypothetical protein
MIPDKSINLTLDKITSFSQPTANSRSFHICMESWVEWADDEAKKGVDVFDKLETVIEIDIFEFLEWFDKKKIAGLKKEAKRWISKV